MSKIVDTSDEWIFSRTGIRERHIAADDQATSDLAYFASLKAMEAAGVTADEIDLIVIGTTTPDLIFPSTALSAAGAAGQRRLRCNGRQRCLFGVCLRA